MSIKSWVRQHRTEAISAAIIIVALCVGLVSWIKYQEMFKKSHNLNLSTNDSSTTAQSKVFKTIKLGTEIKDADGFRKALKTNGMITNTLADTIMSQPQFVVTQGDVELDLVVVTVKDLGFKDVVTKEQIYARAKEKGLKLCPPDVGPQLRLQYKDQYAGEWLIIGMKPIGGVVDTPIVFTVGAKLFLDGAFVGSGDFFNQTHRWVFVRPRK